MGETFVKTFSADSVHLYHITKVVNMLGQSYYKATPLNKGVPKTAETEVALENLLRREINPPVVEMKRNEARTIVR